METQAMSLCRTLSVAPQVLELDPREKKDVFNTETRHSVSSNHILEGHL